MKKILLLIVILFSVSFSFAQEEELSEKEKARREKNIQAGNPFKRFGYTPKIATLSKGKYLEFHDLDSIVRIGSYSYHVKRKEITGYTKLDTVHPESTLRPEIISRWFSPDPLSDEFPSWSPYSFVYNNPVRFVDPDGRAPEIIDPVGKKAKAAYSAYYASASPQRRANLDRLHNDKSITYRIKVGGNINKTSYNFKKERIDISIMGNAGKYTNGLFADELTHAIQYQDGEIGYYQTKSAQGTISYDLQDELNSKTASIDAFTKSGVSITDDFIKSKGGELSAKYGELLNETNNNPTNSQLTDWAKTKHSTENMSYSDLINSSGGSMKVGVENKATILVLPKSIQKQLTKVAIKNNN